MDRSVAINIAGKEYKLVLTTKATKDIATRYGGLEDLGEKLLKNENFGEAIDEIVWLITLLVNQGIMIDNLHNGEKKELITTEEIELLTSPFELSEYKDAIVEAMNKGMKRQIESEENPGKN